MPIMDPITNTGAAISYQAKYLSKKYNYEYGHQIDKKKVSSCVKPYTNSNLQSCQLLIQIQIRKESSQALPIIDPNTNKRVATWSEQCRSYMVTREITARLRRISFETRGEDRPRSK